MLRGEQTEGVQNSRQRLVCLNPSSRGLLMHPERTMVGIPRSLSEETLSEGRSNQHREDTLPSGAVGTLVHPYGSGVAHGVEFLYGS